MLKWVGRGSSVGIATAYGLEGLGIKSRWGRDFPHLSRTARGVMLTTHPHLVTRSWKSRAIPLLPLWAHVACYRVNPQCLQPGFFTYRDTPLHMDKNKDTYTPTTNQALLCLTTPPTTQASDQVRPAPSKVVEHLFQLLHIYTPI